MHPILTKVASALSGGLASKIFLGLTLVGFAGAAFAANLYLKQRDRVAAMELAFQVQRAENDELSAMLLAEAERAAFNEQVRMDLVRRNEELSNQEAEVVTEFREIIRDRIVREEVPVEIMVQAECADVLVPADAIRLLHCNAAGECEPSPDLQTDTVGFTHTM